MQQLKKLGFEHIDALDPSVPMLNVAKDRDLYENYYIEYLTDAKLPIPDSKYETGSTSGLIDEKKIPNTNLDFNMPGSERSKRIWIIKMNQGTKFIV